MSYATNNASRGMEAIQKVIHRFCAEKMGEQSAWELIGEIYNAVNRADQFQGECNKIRENMQSLEMELAEKREELKELDDYNADAREKLEYWLKGF